MSDADPHISRTTFLRLASLAAWPAVPEPALDPTPAAWSRWTALSTPPDRTRVAAALVPRFSTELIASPSSEQRLASWFALGRPSPSDEEIERDLVAMGLGPSRPVIVAALRQVPPPVRHHVLTRCWLIAITADCSGWCWSAPPERPSQLIALDAKTTTREELLSIVAHEIAHAWLTGPAPVGRVTTIRERQEQAALVARLADEWRLENPLVRVAERDERQAAALAASWGFGGEGADGDFCATGARLAATPERW